MTDHTTELLSERAKTHGEYTDNARITMDIVRACESGASWDRLPDPMKTSIFMIAMKLHRIANGDPYVSDHWDDIAGYARLISERMDRIRETDLGMLRGTGEELSPSQKTMRRELLGNQKVGLRPDLRTFKDGAGGHNQPFSTGDPVYVTGDPIIHRVERLDGDNATLVSVTGDVIVRPLSDLVYARKGYVPGTPEDGGHHAKQSDEAEESWTDQLLARAKPGPVPVQHEDDRRDEHKMRRPRQLTHHEWMALQAQVVEDGTMLGHHWTDLYAVPEDWDSGRPTMRTKYVEEYGR